MLGKSKSTYDYTCVDEPKVILPFEQKMTRSEWEGSEAQEQAENKRVELLQDLLERIQDEPEAHYVLYLSEAYKNVRGY